MTTFAELVLESIENNYHHTGVVTDVDHDNKIIYVNPNKTHVINTALRYAAYGATGAGLTGALIGKHMKDGVLSNGLQAAIGGATGGAIGGTISGIYRKIKEKEAVNDLLRSGYKVQYTK